MARGLLGNNVVTGMTRSQVCSRYITKKMRWWGECRPHNFNEGAIWSWKNLFDKPPMVRNQTCSSGHLSQLEPEWFLIADVFVLTSQIFIHVWHCYSLAARYILELSIFFFCHMNCLYLTIELSPNLFKTICDFCLNFFPFFINLIACGKISTGQ